MKKECVLYDRECISCGECDICDLDPKKICNNCGKCIDSGNDYNIMDVDLTSEESNEPLNYHYEDEDLPEDDEFFDENFEEDSDEYLEGDDFFDEEDEDEDDDDNLEFDFGEFFGKR